MRKAVKTIRLFFKELGYLKYVIYAVTVGLAVFCWGNGIQPLSILESFEMFIFPLSGWWVIQEFYSYVDEEEREVYMSYPLSRRYIGIIGYTCAFSLFAVPAVMILACLLRQQNSVLFYGTMFSEILVWISMGFFFVMMTKNIVVSVGIIWIYASMQILDISGSFRPISICFYFVSDIHIMFRKMIVLFFIAAALSISAQKKFEMMFL